MVKRKIIIFSYDFPPSDGGIARLCHEISIHGSPYYNSVIVLTRQKNGISKPYNKDNSVKTIEASSRRGRCEIDCLKYLRSIKNKDEYDILCGLWHPEATIALLSGFKNVFVLVHGTELLSGNSLFRKYFWLPVYSRIILQKAKGVIANSHYTLGLVKSIDKKVRSTAIPLAVNHNFFIPQQKESKNDIISICSVSRIHQYKGHDFILRTISKLPSEYQQKIRYNIAGKGKYLPEIEELARVLHLENIVSFHGFVEDEALPDFYNKNDLFILCTREESGSKNVEGFGLVFLEAQACGLPVIGTHSGGIPDAIENDNGGWLIEQDDEAELSNLLINLIDNPGKLQEMGLRARKRVERMCTWVYYCKNLFKFMSE